MLRFRGKLFRWRFTCPACSARIPREARDWKMAWSRWNCEKCGATVRQRLPWAMILDLVEAVTIFFVTLEAPRLLSDKHFDLSFILMNAVMIGWILVSYWVRPYIAPLELLARFACHQCGYDLTGNISGVCPECGSKIQQGMRTQLSQR